jgi:putative transposase
MPMLEGEPHLTLELLNRATQAWAEQEYQRHLHSEIKQTPLERWLDTMESSVERRLSELLAP